MKRKWLALILAALILMLPGCKVSQSAVTSTGSAALPEIEQDPPAWQQKTDPVQLTIDSEITAGPDSNLLGDWPLWGEDPVSRHIMDLTGVKLVQRKHFDTIRFDVLMASNDWMDLYSAQGITTGHALSDASMSWSLDELAEKYCPEFWDTVDPLEILNNTDDDGHIYTLRSGYYNNDVYADEDMAVDPPYMLAFNTKWLDRAGVSMPTSVEELETALTKVKELQLGLMPMLLSDAMASPVPGWMGIMEDTYWDQEKRSVLTPLRQEGWVDYLKLMNRWHQQELLFMPTAEDKPNLEWYDTESDDAAINDRAMDLHSWISGKSALSAAVPYYTNRIDSIVPLRKGAAQETDLPWKLTTQPLTWQGETAYTAQDNAAYRYRSINRYFYSGRGLFITKQCSDPERALLFYQFLLSDDGMKLTHWGIEGTHYTLNDQGEPVFTEKCRLGEDVQAVALPEEEALGFNYWLYVPSNYYDRTFRKHPENYMTNYDAIQLARQLNEAGRSFKKAAEGNKCPVLQFAETAYGSDDYTAYMAIMHHWLNVTEEIITQSADAAEVEDRWAALMTELRTMGLDNLEQSMTLRFAEALERYHKAGYFTEIQP